MKENDKVVALLKNYFLETESELSDGFSSIYDWMDLYINIKSVSFDVAKYDDSIIYCGAAYYYEEDRMRRYELYNLELIRFNYIWGVFESLAEYLLPSDRFIHRGPVNATCGWLKDNRGDKPLPKYYSNVIWQLIPLLFNNKQYYEKLKDSIDNVGNPIGKKQEYIDFSGIGIYMVSQVRHLFAHGKTLMPNNPDEEDYFNELLLTIKLASTIVIMTLIMLISNIYDCNYIIKDSVYLSEFDGMNMSNWLINLFQD